MTPTSALLNRIVRPEVKTPDHNRIAGLMYSMSMKLFINVFISLLTYECDKHMFLRMMLSVTRSVFLFIFDKRGFIVGV